MWEICRLVEGLYLDRMLLSALCRAERGKARQSTESRIRYICTDIITDAKVFG